MKHFQVYDIASQTINNSWRNSKQKFTKFYANLVSAGIQTTIAVVISFVFSS